MPKLPHKLPHKLAQTSALSVHKLLPPYVVGGAVCAARADCAVRLGALDPDCSTWGAIVAAFSNPVPEGRPQRIGTLAARGLLELTNPPRSEPCTCSKSR